MLMPFLLAAILFLIRIAAARWQQGDRQVKRKPDTVSDKPDTQHEISADLPRRWVTLYIAVGGVHVRAALPVLLDGHDLVQVESELIRRPANPSGS